MTTVPQEAREPVIESAQSVEKKAETAIESSNPEKKDESAPLKRKAEGEPKEAPPAKAPKLEKKHTSFNENGNRFYLGETCLGKYKPDGMFYECTIREIKPDGDRVTVSWFNANPLYNGLEIDNLAKADTKNFYVGERVWATYKPDGQLYEATIDKIDKKFGIVESITVTWFNNNPAHRQIAHGLFHKMSELDFQERYDDPNERANLEKEEIAALQDDLDMDVNELLRKQYGINV